MDEFHKFLESLGADDRQAALKSEIARRIYELEEPFYGLARDVVPSFIANSPRTVAVDDAGGRIPAHYVVTLARLAAKETNRPRTRLMRIAAHKAHQDSHGLSADIGSGMRDRAKDGRVVTVTESMVGGGTLDAFVGGFAQLGITTDVIAFQSLHESSFYESGFRAIAERNRVRPPQIFIADPGYVLAAPVIFEQEPYETARGIDTPAAYPISAEEHAHMQAGAYSAARELARQHYARIRLEQGKAKRQ